VLVGDAMRSPAILLSPATPIAVARRYAPKRLLVGEGGTLLGIALGSDLDDALRQARERGGGQRGSP